VPVCGDGFIDDPESREDGDLADGDDCSADCLLAPILKAEPNDDSYIQTNAGGEQAQRLQRRGRGQAPDRGRGRRGGDRPGGR
jgi:cysteine-rich repeat protein